MKVYLKKIAPFISVLFFGLAIWFLNHELRNYDLREVATQLSGISFFKIIVSVFLSFLSYIVLTGYDALGILYIGEKLSPRRTMRAGFISYAFSHNIGLALLTGGSMRYRIYSAWGFSGIQVTQIVAFSALTLWLGFCAVAGSSLLFATPHLPNNLSIPFVPLRILGIILLLMVAGYLWFSGRINKEFSAKGWSFTFPDFSMAIKQVGIASLDWLIASSVLYILLPDSQINFISFAGVFLLAQIIGLFSQVPGGLGVFESVMLLYLSNFMTGSTALGILLVYRIIYYILPLLVAMVMLAYQEYHANRKAVKEFGQKAANWFPRVVPHVLSACIFIGGTTLLFSGATPSEASRMVWLQRFLPLSIIETSHFLASLTGAGLLVLSVGLQRRIDGAYHLTIGLLSVGVVFSLLKGVSYEEAIILTVMLAALIPCREEFHRKASLLTQRFSPGWITLILMVICSFIWLGIFSYRNVEYQNELWWQFSLMGDAPRYLRASVAVLGGAFILGLIKLLKPRPVETEEPAEHEIERAATIVAKSRYAEGNLVFLKDKELLFNTSHNAFVMSGKEGKSRIALGDPVGPSGEVEELVWRYKELCEEHSSWPVFFQVKEDYMDIYVDLGLTQLKIGEEAKVSLQSFDPERSVSKWIKDRHEEGIAAGYSFDVLSREEARKHMLIFKSISETWLLNKSISEKKFSMGYFDEEYLQHFSIAVVYLGGEIIAFSNILRGADTYELTTDLLRHRCIGSAPVIDYLLIELMGWAKQQGCVYFNLGMAPLLGMNENEMFREWNKVAAFVYTNGENIHDFQEARTYKNHFGPEWELRYLVCPGGLAIPGVLSNLGSLVTGGYKEMLT